MLAPSLQLPLGHLGLEGPVFKALRCPPLPLQFERPSGRWVGGSHKARVCVGFRALKLQVLYPNTHLLDLHVLNPHGAVRALGGDPIEERLHGAGDDAFAVAPEGIGGAHGVRLAGARLACSKRSADAIVPPT